MSHKQVGSFVVEVPEVEARGSLEVVVRGMAGSLAAGRVRHRVPVDIRLEDHTMGVEEEVGKVQEGIDHSFEEAQQQQEVAAEEALVDMIE